MKSKILSSVLNPDNLLLILTVIGVVLGVILGVALRPLGLDSQTILLLSFPGEILMRVLQLLILPIIITSLISALASLDMKSSGRLGLYQVAYYATTTTLASITGIILVTAIQPGYATTKPNFHEGAEDDGRVPSSNLDSILDLLRNMFAENIFQATFQQHSTVSTKVPVKNESGGNDTFIIQKEAAFLTGTNVLGIVIFCIAFGVIAGSLGEEASAVVEFFKALDKIVMKLVGAVMWYFPIGIIFVIMGNILEMENPVETLKSLGMYIATVMAGLTFHALVTLMLLYFLAIRKNPFRLIKDMAEALLTAFGTNTSSAALPMSFHCLETKQRVAKQVTRLIMPVGAVINMDGTALYEAVAAVYLAQANALPLNFGKVITISLTCTLGSIGASTIPNTGLAPLMLVSAAFGIPVRDVAFLLPLDWFIDRYRTAINVLGDATGACVVNKVAGNTISTPAPTTTPKVISSGHLDPEGGMGEFRLKSPRLSRIFRRRVGDTPEPQPVGSIKYIHGSTISL